MHEVSTSSAPVAQPDRPAPASAEPAGVRRKGLVLALILLAQFLVVVDGSIVTLALPAIQRALHFPVTGLQWVISGYALAFGGFLLLGGRSADLLGRRRILIAGVSLFTISSLACGLARSAGMLVAARAAEGLGAAMMAPAALSLLLAIFAEGAERNKALGAFGAATGAGGATGVLAGGALTTWLSWQWIFFVNLPAGVAILACARVLLPESRARLGHRRFDAAGAVTVTAGLTVLVYAVASASTHHWASATTIVLLAGAAALIGAFGWIEARSQAPLLPLSFFRNRTAAAANLAGLLIGGLMLPMFFFLSLYMQQVLGYSAIKTGLAFLVVAAGMIASSGLAQALVTRAGVRVVLTAGTLAFAAAQLLFSRLPAAASFTRDLLPGFLLVAAALGLAVVGDFVASAIGVKPADAGLASGLINTTQQIGGAAGIAVTSATAAARTASLLHSGHAPAAALTAGFHSAFAVTAGLALAAAVVTVAFIPAHARGRAAAPQPQAEAVPLARDETEVRTLLAQLDRAAWSLAIVLKALRKGLLHRPRTTGPPSAELDVLAALGLCAAHDEGYRPAPAWAAFGTDRRALLAEQLATTFQQTAALLAQDGGSRWADQDDAALLAQGRASAQTVGLLTRNAFPGLAGLTERLARPGSAILDVGTGVGAMAAAYAQAWPATRVVGIDTLPRALALARRTLADSRVAGRVELRTQDVRRLREEDTYDLAWLPLPFIAPDAVCEALPLLRRALHPGGWLIVGYGKLDGPQLAAAHSRVRTELYGGTTMRAGELARTLTTAGFTDVRAIPTPPGAPGFAAGRRPSGPSRPIGALPGASGSFRSPADETERGDVVSG
jgi:EmrB/QacA subfamily drug resistance transporter